jgi:hypothetical protein
MKRIVYIPSGIKETGTSNLGNAILYVERLIERTKGDIIITRRRSRVSLFAESTGLELTFERCGTLEADYACLYQTLFEIVQLRNGKCSNKDTLITVGDIPEDVPSVRIDSEPPVTDDGFFANTHGNLVANELSNLPHIDKGWSSAAA